MGLAVVVTLPVIVSDALGKVDGDAGAVTRAEADALGLGTSVAVPAEEAPPERLPSGVRLEGGVWEWRGVAVRAGDAEAAVCRETVALSPREALAGGVPDATEPVLAAVEEGGEEMLAETDCAGQDVGLCVPLGLPLSLGDAVGLPAPRPVVGEGGRLRVRVEVCDAVLVAVLVMPVALALALAAELKEVLAAVVAVRVFMFVALREALREVLGEGDPCAVTEALAGAEGEREGGAVKDGAGERVPDGVEEAEEQGVDEGEGGEEGLPVAA